jgi:hypothetical protein
LITWQRTSPRNGTRIRLQDYFELRAWTPSLWLPLCPTCRRPLSWCLFRIPEWHRHLDLANSCQPALVGGKPGKTRDGHQLSNLKPGGCPTFCTFWSAERLSRHRSDGNRPHNLLIPAGSRGVADGLPTIRDGQEPPIAAFVRSRPGPPGGFQGSNFRVAGGGASPERLACPFGRHPA